MTYWMSSWNEILWRGSKRKTCSRDEKINPRFSCDGECIGCSNDTNLGWPDLIRYMEIVDCGIGKIEKHWLSAHVPT